MTWNTLISLSILKMKIRVGRVRKSLRHNIAHDGNNNKLTGATWNAEAEEITEASVRMLNFMIYVVSIDVGLDENADAMVRNDGLNLLY